MRLRAPRPQTRIGPAGGAEAPTDDAGFARVRREKAQPRPSKSSPERGGGPRASARGGGGPGPADSQRRPLSTCRRWAPSTIG